MNEMAKVFMREVAQKHTGKGALVVGLRGDLGAGKTAFVKEFAKEVRIPRTINSPTFIIENLYNIPEGGEISDKFNRLVHIDAYRLDGPADTDVLEWESVFSDPKTVVFVEWPEIVEEVLPRSMVNISFEFIDENTREIEF